MAMSRDEETIIEGRNGIIEAFRSGKSIERLFLLDGSQDGPMQTIKREAKKQGLRIEFVSRQRLDQLSPSGKHQGALAYISAHSYASVDDIMARAEASGEPPFIFVLDGVMDPHNLGAIIRTANMSGAHGVIIPKHSAVGLTGTVMKASAGALNYTLVARVSNLNNTLKDLKKRGLWFACAAPDGEEMYSQDLSGPIGLVIGGEGSGVSRLLRENCDFVTSTPTKGDIDSLNASVAAGVLAFEIVRQRRMLISKKFT